MFKLDVDASCELRILLPTHAQALQALTEENRAHLSRWLPSWLSVVPDEAGARDFIQSQLARIGRGTGFYAGIWVSGSLAGIIGLNTIESTNRSGDLGLWLGELYCKRGLALRSAAVFLTFAFTELQLNKVEFAAAEENVQSIRFIQHLGATFEGTRRSAELINDQYVDHSLYSLLRAEFLLSDLHNAMGKMTSKLPYEAHI